jgi:hypothetical protein
MAAPRTPVMPDRESFCALAGDLVRDHVVDLPAYLLSGTIGPHATPLAFTNKMYGYFRALWAAKNEGRSEPEPPARLTDDKFTVDVRRLGDDLDTVLAGLYAAPIGAQDVCVLFSGLATPPGVEPPAHYTMPDNVGLFALRQPRSLYGEAFTAHTLGSYGFQFWYRPKVHPLISLMRPRQSWPGTGGGGRSATL